MNKSVHAVQEDTDDSDDSSDTFFIKMVSHAEDNCTQSQKIKNAGQTVNAVSDDKWPASLLVHGTNETFTIVTGAKANLTNESDFKALSVKRQISSGKVLSLKAHHNQPIKNKRWMQSERDSQRKTALFVVHDCAGGT